MTFSLFLWTFYRRVRIYVLSTLLLFLSILVFAYQVYFNECSFSFFFIVLQLSGAPTGLMRVRRFCRVNVHIFCSENQTFFVLFCFCVGVLVIYADLALIFVEFLTLLSSTFPFFLSCRLLFVCLFVCLFDCLFFTFCS